MKAVISRKKLGKTRTNRQTEGWTDGQTNGWMDEQTDRQTYLSLKIK